jgi:poly-gamma-glutamate synthase PgsB/CapB
MTDRAKGGKEELHLIKNEGRQVLFLACLVSALLLIVALHTLGLDEGWHGIWPVFQGGTFIVILVGMGTAVWYLGVREQTGHFDNLRHVPIRVHVNGIRGKSTVTRLIGGALREGGLKVLTKTTGKAARIIRNDGIEERIERFGKPNIREQVDIMNRAVKEGMDALVIECMAIQPELQRVAEHKLIQATIGVITNVRADHLDVMGPMLEDVAKNLGNTIPDNGTLVTAEKRYMPVFEARATKVGTQIVKADPAGVDDEVLRRFTYLNFKDNVAIALEVARLFGIPDDVAIRGMLKARPDPGLMTITRTRHEGAEFTFINAMGVNDKDSTALVYKELGNRGYLKDAALVGFFHARGDRITRTTDFGRAMVKDMRFDKMVLVGQMTNLFVIEAGKAGYDLELIEDMGHRPGKEVMKTFATIAKDNKAKGLRTVIFGCGNMVGPIPTEVLRLVEAGALSPADPGGGA